MIQRKKPDVSLKLKYPLIIRFSLIGSLVIIILFFLAFPKFENKASEVEQRKKDIELEKQVVTEQNIQQAQAPSEATIPVESEDEDLADQEFDFEQEQFDDYEGSNDFAPPPEPSQEDKGSKKRPKFVPFDKPPKPIGGYQTIQNNIEYPEVAREAGVEGTVRVKAWINKKGIVETCQIEEGIPNTGLNQAAIDAIKDTKFEPAMQRDRKVAVWVTIPVRFSLSG